MRGAVRAFGRFWYDLVIGEDWKLAAGVGGTLALVTTAMVTGLLAGWAIPVAGVGLLLACFAAALLIDARR